MAAAVDPLVDVTSLAHDEGVHLHVDAAWAGALVLSLKAGGTGLNLTADNPPTAAAARTLAAPQELVSPILAMR